MDEKQTVVPKREDVTVRTEGKQPLDEVVDAPRRKPVETTLLSGTKRVDF